MEIDSFRQDLAASLRQCAARKRRLIGEGTSTDRDIDSIILLEHLADDAANLPDHIFAAHQKLFADKQVTTIYFRRQKALFDRIGTDCTPRDASDLIRWFSSKVKGESRSDHLARKASRIDRTGGRVAGWFGPRAFAAVSGRAKVFLLDMSAGIGAVASMAALWETKESIQQWHDHAFVAAHPTVPATVLSVDQTSHGRSVAYADVVLGFRQPDGSDYCQVTVRSGSSFSFPPVGDAIDVVPQSSSCQTPLIPAQIGDPGATFGLALALLAGGLASITLWLWLLRKPARGPIRPIWARLHGERG